MGHMAFTAVYEQEANWGDVARARFAGQAEIVPAVDVRPPGTTQEEVNQTNKRLIDESKPIAAGVAPRAAGHNASPTGQGPRAPSTPQCHPPRPRPPAAPPPPPP